MRALSRPARWSPFLVLVIIFAASLTALEAQEPAEQEPLIKEADPELERLLAEEEEIERRVHDHHETPHFRPGDE